MGSTSSVLFIMAALLIWVSSFFHVRQLGRGRVSGSENVRFLTAGLMVAGFVIVVVGMSSMDAPIALLFLPMAFLATFEAGMIWGRRTDPGRVTGRGDTAAPPSVGWDSAR